MLQPTRRDALRGAAALAGFPAIVPARVLGASAPGDLIQVAQLGCGRIARGSEIAGVLRQRAHARFVAVCDLDSTRLADAKRDIEAAYQSPGSVKTYSDYRQMFADKSIDAVCISTPDHWHALPAIEAALAGKDIYLQKPASLTIREGRQMADVLAKTGRILQLGSQQRSDYQFRFACELVRNGRIGKLKQIFIGLPVDPGGHVEAPMAVPSTLNYDMWLGSTPEAVYTENRVHPQSADPRARYARPGWLRCEPFGAGMITGWGAHHIDIAHWAMDLESSGPVAIEAIATFPRQSLWDVHGPYQARLSYPNGVEVFISDKYPNGLRFIGETGWLWVTRGAYKPGDSAEGKPRHPALDASDLRILREPLKPSDIHLHDSPENNHHLDWLSAIRTRKPPAAGAEAGHRSCSACLLAHAAMKLGRPLQWDPKLEKFLKDDEANGLLARPQRAAYSTDAVYARAMKA